jgi:hypothetical protein
MQIKTRLRLLRPFALAYLAGLLTLPAWPLLTGTLHRYETLSGPMGTEAIIKINRVTGSTDILYPWPPQHAQWHRLTHSR